MPVSVRDCLSDSLSPDLNPTLVESADACLGWKTFFKSAWKKFNTEFQPVIESLARRRQLLESEKGSASLYEISKARQELATWHDERKREARLENLEKHKQRLLQIKEKLAAADYEQDQEMATEARSGVKTGDWLLKTPAYRKWADTTTTGHDVLYVHGVPGAGKSASASFCNPICICYAIVCSQCHLFPS